MTNIRGVTAQREGVVTDEEFIHLIGKLNIKDFTHPYYFYRVKGFCSIARRTGKRKAELGLLRFQDIEIDPDYIRFIFTLKKKRKDTVYYIRSPPKLVERGDVISSWITGYLEYLKAIYPEAYWVFPVTRYSRLTETFTVYPEKRLRERQLLNIVKRLDPSLWCHLFRDSMGADIVKRHKGNIVAVFDVQNVLDLEKTETAFRYLRRYGEQVIGKPL